AQAMPSRPAPSTRVHRVGAWGPSPRTASRSAARTRSRSWIPPRPARARPAAAPRGSGRRAQPRARAVAARLRTPSQAPAAARPVDGSETAHAFEGVDGGVHDGCGAGGHGALDQSQGVGVVAVGQVPQGGAAGSLAAVLGGPDDLGPVLGARDGAETSGGRD